MTQRPQILLCDHLDPAGLAILQRAGDVDIRPGIAEAELQSTIGAYDALIVGHHTKVSPHTIENGFKLRVIGCAGANLDHIDVSTARAYGIEVRNSPTSNSVAAAEQTFALMLNLIVRSGHTNVGLAGKTLALIGFGQIGRQVAQRARAFDMRVIVNQPRLTPELALAAGVELFDLDDLLPQADFVSLHVPLKAETTGLIDAPALARMKPTAFLINTAHPGNVDDQALLAALQQGNLAGAALTDTGGTITGDLAADNRVLIAPHLANTRDVQKRETAVSIAEQVVEILQTQRPSETLSLELLPIDLVKPHEQIDDKRVARLMQRIESDGKLMNPPLVTKWQDQYIILDGATRFASLQRLAYPHIIAQVIDPQTPGFALHTWYHAISNDDDISQLLTHLEEVPEIILMPLPATEINSAFSEKDALSYLLDRHGEATLIQPAPGVGRLAAMNALVATYTSWGDVERTLLTDLGRLVAQFPKLTAVAIFPQYKPETVFNVAARGDLMPAGLTRFVLPGRILRLNADLARLKKDESLPAKRAWFNKFLAEKLARSRVRYYQEPVVLLDE